MSEKNTSASRVRRFFANVTDRVYGAVSRSPIGKLFSSYSTLNAGFRDSGVVRVSQGKRHKSARTLRRNVAQAMDQSLLRRLCYAVIDSVCRCSLRAVGVFFLIAGFYAMLASWLVRVVWQSGTFDGLILFFALGTMLVGVPLLFSDASVAHALKMGVIPGGLLRESLGLSEDAIKDIPQKGKSEYLFVVIFAMLFGALLALVGPFWMLGGILMLLTVLVVITTPETGIILLLLFAPFVGLVPYGKLSLAIAVLLTLFSYACKLMRGTRAFHMEIQDLAVLVLLLFVLLGAVSAGGADAVPIAVFSALLMAIYFPAVNVLATPHWLARSRFALVSAAMVAALLAIFQFVYALVYAMQGVGEVSVLQLGNAVKAGFADHTTFAYFMVLSFPFALYSFLRAKGGYRLPTGFACVTIAAATVLSFVQSAWIALAVEVLFLCLLYRRYIFPYFCIGTVFSVAFLFLIPATWRHAFGALLQKSTDLSTVRMSRALSFIGDVLFGSGGGFFSRGAGILRLLFGLGSGGIQAVCVLYTATAADELLSDFNFWEYCLLEGGILGILLPGILFFLLLQNFLSMLRLAKQGREALSPLSGAAMLFGAITVGVFHYSWYDPSALLLFFALIAIFGADMRYRRERARTVFLNGEEKNEKSAELEYRAREV